MLAANLMRVAVVMIIIGMLLGIAMGISGGHSLYPAHAHLNLVGFVLMFLAGLYYHTVPSAAVTVATRCRSLPTPASVQALPRLRCGALSI